MVRLQITGRSEVAPVLSFTLHPSEYVPADVNVCVAEIDPGDPAFFVMVTEVPSPKKKSAALIYPSRSVPPQVSVTVCTVVALSTGRVERPVQLGRLLTFGTSVGVGGSGVGVAVGWPGAVVAVGTGVWLGVGDMVANVARKFPIFEQERMLT